MATDINRPSAGEPSAAGPSTAKRAPTRSRTPEGAAASRQLARNARSKVLKGLTEEAVKPELALEPIAGPSVPRQNSQPPSPARSVRVLVEEVEVDVGQWGRSVAAQGVTDGEVREEQRPHRDVGPLLEAPRVQTPVRGRGSSNMEATQQARASKRVESGVPIKGASRKEARAILRELTGMVEQEIPLGFKLHELHVLHEDVDVQMAIVENGLTSLQDRRKVIEQHYLQPLKGDSVLSEEYVKWAEAEEEDELEEEDSSPGVTGLKITIPARQKRTASVLENGSSLPAPPENRSAAVHAELPTWETLDDPSQSPPQKRARRT